MTGYGFIAIVAPTLGVLLFLALWRARRDLREVEREVRRWQRAPDTRPDGPDAPMR